MKDCESCSFFGAVLPDLGRIVEALCASCCCVSRGCMCVCVCVSQATMQIFAASSSRSPWMRCGLCRRPRCSTRAPSRPCGWRWSRGPPSSSGRCFTHPLPILHTAPVFCSSRDVPTPLLLFFGSVTCTEVPPPRATFRSRTSTWLWPSCWSWPCRGGLSG